MASNQKKLTLERTLSVIGSTSVGKTALSQKFVMNSFPNEYYPTIEKIHQMELQSENGSYSLTVYDTAGLEMLESIPGKYINSHGFILVYSVTDRQSFETIKEIYNKLKDEFNTRKINIVLIGNKTDLAERCVKYDEGKELAETWKNSGTIVEFIETSAKTGERVQDVFITLLNLIDVSNKPPVEKKPSKKQTNNNNHNSSNSNSCRIS